MAKNPRMFLAALVLVSILSLGESLQEDIKAEETERIVGGKPASEERYPFTVGLYNEGDYICTASIISETAILTAAHCVVIDGETRDPRDFHAIAGVTNKSSSDGKFIEFKKISVHPWYNEMSNDVAILETTAPIEFNKRVQSICIANSKIGSLSLKPVVAVGWGQTNRDTNNPDLPEVLQFTNQIVIPNLKCKLLFLGNPVPSTVICATGLLAGICSGDSGGPLVYYAAKRPVLVGVASYINAFAGCGHLLGPAAFSRVSSYTEYVMKTATGDVCVA